MMLMKAMEARKKAEVSINLQKFELFMFSFCSDLQKSSVFNVPVCIISFVCMAVAGEEAIGTN